MCENIDIANKKHCELLKTRNSIPFYSNANATPQFLEHIPYKQAFSHMKNGRDYNLLITNTCHGLPLVYLSYEAVLLVISVLSDRVCAK